MYLRYVPDIPYFFYNIASDGVFILVMKSVV